MTQNLVTLYWSVCSVWIFGGLVQKEDKSTFVFVIPLTDFPLVDAKIRASDKDLPVQPATLQSWKLYQNCNLLMTDVFPKPKFGWIWISMHSESRFCLLLLNLNWPPKQHEFMQNHGRLKHHATLRVKPLDGFLGRLQKEVKVHAF